ncbi:hypothetical protein Tco_1077524 [Tanacetum coccineum]
MLVVRSFGTIVELARRKSFIFVPGKSLIPGAVSASPVVSDFLATVPIFFHAFFPATVLPDDAPLQPIQSIFILAGILQIDQSPRWLYCSSTHSEWSVGEVGEGIAKFISV